MPNFLTRETSSKYLNVIICIVYKNSVHVHYTKLCLFSFNVDGKVAECEK